MIKNVVFEGGGVLGMAYAGAIEELEDKGILDGIERSAGTSAGAIAALLVSLDYNAKEIKEVMGSTEFKSFEDHKDVLRIPFKYGLYKGDFLLEWIKKIVSRKTKNPNTTFKELQELGYRELKVYACDLNTISVQEFSNVETPDVIVAESIRASMSIPLFFSAWQFPNGIPNDHLFVDGGTIYNYPINAFENYSETIGFFFNTSEVTTSDLHYNHAIKYVEQLFKAILKSQKINFYKNEPEMEITVLIDDQGVSPTNFQLSEKQKTALFNAGKQATQLHLKKRT